MKKIGGMNFGVRFYRRGITKSAAKTETPSEKGNAVNDIPEQIAATVQKAAVYIPAVSAKEKILREAAQNGDCSTIRILVMEGIDLEARDEQGRTALNLATQYNRQDAIKTILAAREMRRLAKQGDLPNTNFFRKFTPKTGSDK